jgi:hypothetical protein
MGWVVNSTPRPLYPREWHGTPLYRRLGRPQGRSGRVLKISPPPGFDPLSLFDYSCCLVIYLEGQRNVTRNVGSVGVSSEFRSEHRWKESANLFGCSVILPRTFEEQNFGLPATTASCFVCSKPAVLLCCTYSPTEDQTARVYLSLWSRRTGMIGWSCHQLVVLQAVARWRYEQCVMERWTAVNTLPLHRLHPLPSPGANVWHKLN